MHEYLSPADWERAWIRTHERAWRSLAIVPADVESEGHAFDMAREMTELAAEHGDTIGLADFRPIPVRQIGALLHVADWHLQNGGRLVYATRSIRENPAVSTIARAADCVLLCVSLGTTSVKSVRDAIAQIGRDRFLGGVVFRPVLPLSESTSLVVRPSEEVEVAP